MAFTPISPNQIQGNPFELIGKDWMLITAGDANKCNTMTASWGQLGIMWNKPVAMAYIRPQRFTRQFVEEQARFTLSFFDGDRYRPALNLLGTKSGRDGDKIAEAGLHTVLLDNTPAFEEAKLVLVCRKLYQADLQQPHFIDPALVGQYYPDKDFHRLYVGEIEQAYIQE